MIEGSLPSAPLLLTIEQAAERLTIGRSLMYQLVLRGRVRSIRIGRCRRIAMADLEVYVDQLRGVQEPVAASVLRPLSTEGVDVRMSTS